LTTEQRTYESVLIDIQENPVNHVHVDLNGLQACCFVEGAVDLRLIEAHGQYAPVGRNGGRACDVLDGPCSCGAWHRRG
jgi:hypothetical protein